MHVIDQPHMWLKVISAVEALDSLRGVDAIVERALALSRQLTNAEAGSIFVLERTELRFASVQNEALFKGEGVDPAVYTDFTLPLNSDSIVGFAATVGQPVNIEDAYSLEGVPYRFNKDFDRRTGYRTRSILALPLKNCRGEVIGVVQLINARNQQGAVIPFDSGHEKVLPFFVRSAAMAVERGLMHREMVLRMMKMAELRDPTETGSHVQRVGAFSAEVYHQWALMRGVERQERTRFKDLLRVAAMLHDVGKVGISDLILKKPGRLDEREFSIMRWHPVLGARLFANTTSDLDQMALDISLNHHEKYNGKGYPGHVADLFGPDPTPGPPRRGEDIPLSARIVALTDVYDALTSRRCYKEPWPEEKTLKMIQEEAGAHFDPEVVDAFLSVHDVCLAIRERYRDQEDGTHGISLEARLADETSK